MKWQTPSVVIRGFQTRRTQDTQGKLIKLGTLTAEGSKLTGDWMFPVTGKQRNL